MRWKHSRSVLADPQPTAAAFNAGEPETAGPELVALAKQSLADSQKKFERAAERAIARMG
jgi:hypothetical protein